MKTRRFLFDAARSFDEPPQSAKERVAAKRAVRAVRAVAFAVVLSAFALFANRSRAEISEYSAPSVAPAPGVACGPAIVNPATASPLRETISLRGNWDFATLPDYREPTGSQGARDDAKVAPEFPSEFRQIRVPGCWEAQGVGEPGTSRTWDMTFDANPRPLKNVYVGAALYRRTVEIPTTWSGREIWLNVGGVRTEAYFWIDGRPLGAIDGYCGTWKFRVGDAARPGETIEILALVRSDLPSRKGQMCDFHTFGGFYRDLELEATPKVWIDDAWARGEILNPKKPGVKNAQVRLTVRANVDAPTTSEATISICELGGKNQNVAGKTLATRSVSIDVAPGRATETIVDIPIPDEIADSIENWSPENPVLYLAEATLINADGSQTGRTERFGFRRFEVRGDRFFLNGKPYFLRGYGETFIYPLTIVSPADRDVHRANMRVVKRAGFNAARMHTHCEIPEYFEAADELGILLQPELPYYRDAPTEAFEFDPMRDIDELYRHYRRHVSFAIYSCGNEGWLGSPLDVELYEWRKATDPDRLLQHQDGGASLPGNSDYTSTPIPGQIGLILPWARGAYADLEIPFVAHEYMNQTVMLDPRLEPKFTGAIPSPVSLRDYEEELARFNLTREQGDACVRAAHALQAWINKEGVETARVDPDCDGFSFWNLIDQMVAQDGVYTSQGFLNAFYETKDGGASPEDFREYNGPTALVAEFPDVNVFESGEYLTVDFWISRFEETPLPAGRVRLSLASTDPDSAATLWSDAFDFNALAPGEVSLVSALRIETPQVEKPRALELIAEIEGTDVRNSWPVWIFPVREKPTLKNVAVSDALFDRFAELYDGVVRESDAPETLAANALVIARPGEDALRRADEAGRPTLVIYPTNGERNVELGWWQFGGQLGTATFESPALGDFPIDGTMSQLWFRLIKNDPIDLAETPEFVANQTIKPIVLGRGTRTYFLYLGETPADPDAGKARRIVVAGIDAFQDVPEARYLLDALIRRGAQGAEK